MATSSGGLMRKRWRIWNLALVLVAFGLNFSFGFYFNHEPSLRQHLPRKRIRSSKSQTGHDTDGIFVKEGDLMVSTGRFPLIGLPKFSPKFHVGVLLSSGEMMMDDTYLLFDFIPDKATEFTTAAALFRGQRVAGLVREKVSHLIKNWGFCCFCRPLIKGLRERVVYILFVNRRIRQIKSGPPLSALGDCAARAM